MTLLEQRVLVVEVCADGKVPDDGWPALLMENGKVKSAVRVTPPSPNSQVSTGGTMNYAKAIAAGLVAGISFAIPVVDNGVTPSEILGIVLAALVGSGVTAAVPNRDTV